MGTNADKRLDLKTQKYVTDGQGSSTEIDSMVRETHDLYRSYRGAGHLNWAKQFQDSTDFKLGHQWTDEEASAMEAVGMMPVVINIVKKTIELMKALMTHNTPRFNTVGQEDSDNKVANIFSLLCSNIWSRSDGDVHHKQIIDDYYSGRGVWYAYFDQKLDAGKGEIRITSLDPLSVYVDPNAVDRYGRDAAEMIVVTESTFERLQQRIPSITPLLNRTKPVQGSDRPTPRRTNSAMTNAGMSNVHARYQEYNRFTKINIIHHRVRDTITGYEWDIAETRWEEFMAEVAFRETNLATGEIGYLTEPGLRKQAKEIFEQTGGMYHFTKDPESGQIGIEAGQEQEGSVPNSTRLLEQITNADCLRERVLLDVQRYDTKVRHIMVVGDQLVKNTVLPVSEYPVVLVPNHFSRNPFSDGDINDVKPLQKYYNKLHSTIMAHAANATSVKVFIPEGSQDEKVLEAKMKKVGTSVISFPAELGAPMIAGPVPLSGELYQIKGQLEQSVMQLCGVFDLSQGDASNAPDTHKGTMLIDEFGQRRMRSKLKDIEGAITQLGRVVLEMIQAYYTEEKTIRIVEPNHTKELTINQPIYDSYGMLTTYINDVSIGRYDIQVITGSMLPSNRWAQYEYYKELFQLGAIDRTELLKKTEIVDVEGVLKRIQEVQQLQQQITQMEQTIKDLQGDLQTARRESVHDRQRVELEKFKTSINEMQSNAKANTEVAKQRVGDNIKMFEERLAMEEQIQAMQSQQSAGE